MGLPTRFTAYPGRQTLPLQWFVGDAEPYKNSIIFINFYSEQSDYFKSDCEWLRTLPNIAQTV
jgi:hypothetical protein